MEGLGAFLVVGSLVTGSLAVFSKELYTIEVLLDRNNLVAETSTSLEFDLGNDRRILLFFCYSFY